MRRLHLCSRFYKTRSLILFGAACLWRRANRKARNRSRMAAINKTGDVDIRGNATEDLGEIIVDEEGTGVVVIWADCLIFSRAIPTDLIAVDVWQCGAVSSVLQDDDVPWGARSE